MDIQKYKSLINEFFRYFIVGGISFVIDITVLYLFKEYVFKSLPYSLYLSTATGFIAGVAVNYFLCLHLVFRSVKATDLGKDNKSKMLFVVIGIIGLGMNELGMTVGVVLLSIDYLIVKVVTAAIVLLWNYLARKYLIFNVKYAKQNRII